MSDAPPESLEMMLATCPDLRSWQDLLDDGAGDPGELARHLESCPGCQLTLEMLAAEPSVWEDAARGLPDPARGEPALRDVIERMKGGEPEEQEEALDFLRPSEKEGVLGLLGQYEVLGVIGRGGMGVVLKATDPALNRMVAI